MATIAAAVKAATGRAPGSRLDQITALVDRLEQRLGELDESLGSVPGGEWIDRARHFRDAVRPSMARLREVADEIETTIADDLWPLPTYSEMLFIR